jgi:hypothetical protein
VDQRTDCSTPRGIDKGTGAIVGAIVGGGGGGGPSGAVLGVGGWVGAVSSVGKMPVGSGCMAPCWATRSRSAAGI